MPDIRNNTPINWTVIFLILSALCLIFVPIHKIYAENYISVKTQEEGKDDSKLEYFNGNIPAEDFYNYYRSRPNTGMESPRSCLIIPYRAPSTKTSLIIIMGDPSSPYEGSGQLRVAGLAEETELVLRDDSPNSDPNDEYSFDPPVANFQWSWSPGSADGAIISGLSEDPNLTLDFKLLESVDKVRILTGNPRSPNVIILDPAYDISLHGGGEDVMPEPKFSAPKFSRPGEPVTFTVYDSTDREGEIVQYGWDFDGDGHFSFVSQKNKASYSFRKTGDHEVTLRVTDERGNRAIKRRKISVVEKPVEARMVLSASKVPPGETISCEIKITARTPVSGLGVENSIPDNWEVVPTENNEAIYKPTTDRWLLAKKLRAGETRKINFKLKTLSSDQVSSDATNRKVKLAGKISSASPEFNARITGDTHVTLIRTIDSLAALSHYDVDNQELNFELSDRISDRQIEKALDAWSKGEKLPRLEKVELDIDFVKKALLYHQKGVSTELELNRISRNNPEAIREITTELPGNLLFVNRDNTIVVDNERIVEFRVKVSIKSRNRTMMGVGLEEKIPESWNIIPETTSNVTFNPYENQWVVTRPLFSGEKFTINYTVQVPVEAAPGTYSLTGVLSESWSNSSYDIEDDRSLQLVKTLPVNLAISRWNIEKGKLDLAMDNYISETQAKKAIELWVNDKPVPHTGGERLTFDRVQEIIAYQLEGKSLDDLY